MSSTTSPPSTTNQTQEGFSLDFLPPEAKALLNMDNFKLAPALDAHAQSTLLRPNSRLARALENSTANGLPPINVLPMAGQHLSVLTQLMGAKTVLEIGTLGGYSSIVFAQAGAKVTSVEINEKHRDVALQNTEGLDVDVILGAALDVMPKLYEEGRQFDMVFIDGDWKRLSDEFDWAVKLTRVGGCIFLDDVIPSMILHAATKGGVGDVGSMLGDDGENVIEKIGKDQRVQATLMPQVGSHSKLPVPIFTGFILAVVKSH